MIFNLQTIVALEMRYRYAFLFPTTIVEGPIVSIVGGFLASAGYLNPWLVYFCSLLGDVIGDSALYLIGRFGRESFILKYGKYFGLRAARVAMLEHHFAQHSVKTLLVGKVAHGAGALVLASAGTARMRYAKFFAVNLLASIVKSAAFVLIGIYFGREYERANSVLNATALFTIFVLVVFVLTFVIPRRIRRTSRLDDNTKDLH